jgi:flagellar biosynthesis protein FlhG
MATHLLSIDDVIRATGLEESVLRFYESEYPEKLPKKILQGDILLFPSQSIEAFLDIHSHVTSGTKPKKKETKKFGRVIAVTSGKGGVGKSNITLNLAIELQRLGKLCVVLDADMGLANIHLLSGITPQYDLRDLLTGKACISDLIMPGPEGIGIIAGGSGILAMADSKIEERQEIITALSAVEEEADIVLVDTGAGLGAGVRDFLACADELIFVLTPDITSLADAYGLLKVVSQDNVQPRSVYSVINMVQTLKQAAEVAVRFSNCAGDFLGLDVKNIGYILRDSNVGGAIARRCPYTVFRPMARASCNTRNIAKDLVKHELPDVVTTSAFSRFRKMIRTQQQNRQERMKTA